MNGNPPDGNGFCHDKINIIWPVDGGDNIRATRALSCSPHINIGIAYSMCSHEDRPKCQDGIMQVSDASGFREKWARDTGNGALCNNTPMGIESNVIDAISYMNGLSVHIDNYRVGYGNAFDNICESRTIRIVLHYNGGPNSIGIYKSERGVLKYLERDSYNLQRNVPSDIGFDYAKPSLVEYLVQGQQIVDTLLDS